mgnify:CR=1 FL=1
MTDTFEPDDFRRRLRAAWDAHSRRLLLYLRAMAVSDDAAEEALQAAFAGLAGQLARGRVVRHDAAYLYRAARNALFARSRDDRHAPLDAAGQDDVAGWFESQGTGDAPGGLDPSAAAEALRELPDEQREAVVLKIWSGMTFKDIGRLTGVSPHTAAGRYRYGIAKLRDRFEG